MPTSNPLIPDLNQTDFTIAVGPPVSAPSREKLLWFDSVANRLYLSIGTISTDDWRQIGGQGGASDGAVLDRLLVANNQVLTDGSNVLYIN